MASTACCRQCYGLQKSRSESYQLSPYPGPWSGSQQPKQRHSTNWGASCHCKCPVAEPVERQLAAGEAQGILLGEPSEEEDPSVLALPQALVACQYCLSQNTNLWICKACDKSATASANCVVESFPPHGGCVVTLPTLCQCILFVWGVLIPAQLCAASSAHIVLLHGQHLHGQSGLVPRVLESQFAAYWEP